MDTKYVRYLLDTNIVNELVEKNPVVLKTYREVYQENILIPVIVYAECIGGWINKANSDTKKAHVCYRMILRYLDIMRHHEVLPFTDEAVLVFGKLPANIGVGDKRIASCAIAHGYVVVTRNRKDFEKLLPDYQIADWTVEPNFG